MLLGKFHCGCIGMIEKIHVVHFEPYEQYGLGHTTKTLHGTKKGCMTIYIYICILSCILSFFFEKIHVVHFEPYEQYGLGHTNTTTMKFAQ
jgi:hypothetical protein